MSGCQRARGTHGWSVPRRGRILLGRNQCVACAWETRSVVQSAEAGQRAAPSPARYDIDAVPSGRGLGVLPAGEERDNEIRHVAAASVR